MFTLPFFTVERIDADILEEKVRDTEHGAVVTFQGVVRRDKTAAGEIDRLFYEAYTAMAEQELKRLLAEIARRWPNTAAVIQHRLGSVPAGDTSLFIAVSSPHRAQAFEACRYALEQLKTSVPIWKKDFYTDGNSQWTASHHETMLIADTSLVIPQS